MSIKINMAQFRDGIRQKVVQIQEATRPAAQAGAQVLYDAARMNVIANGSVSKEAHIFYGRNSKNGGQKYLFYPGDLLKSVYQAHSRRNSGPGKETYHVSYNMTKCPYAHMVEFGTSRAAAKSFIGKAIHEQRDEALQAMQNEFAERMNK